MKPRSDGIVEADADKELIFTVPPPPSPNSGSTNNKIVVLGAAGTIGQVIAWDWLHASPKHEVVLADRDASKVKALAKRLGDRASATVVDLFQPAHLRAVLRQGALVINSTSHHFNLHVMLAALHANVHYLDLGGLFHFTRKQLKWRKRFEEIGKIAILGMGCAPGISNIMARALTEGWEKVHRVEVMVGGVGPDEPLTALPYAWKTLYEELTLKPAVFHGGKWTFADPLSGVVSPIFAKPIGKQKVFYTLHSEVATLPLFFRARGIKEVSFRIGLGEEIQQMVLNKGKMISSSPQQSGKSKAPSAKLKTDYESTMVVAAGKNEGRLIEKRMEFLSYGHSGWRAGDLNTACPASVAAELILKGKIDAAGVWSPEEAVPWKEMKAALEKRKFRFT